MALLAPLWSASSFSETQRSQSYSLFLGDYRPDVRVTLEKREFKSLKKIELRYTISNLSNQYTVPIFWILAGVSDEKNMVRRPHFGSLSLLPGTQESLAFMLPRESPFVKTVRLLWGMNKEPLGLLE